MNDSTFNTEAALSAVDLTDALANSSLNIEPDALSDALLTVNSWVIAERDVDKAKNATAVAFLKMGFTPDDLAASSADPKTWALAKMILKRGLPQPVLDLIASGGKAPNMAELVDAAGMQYKSANNKVNSLASKLKTQMQDELDKRNGKVDPVTGELLDSNDASHRKHLWNQTIDKFDDAIKKGEALEIKFDTDPDFAKTCGKADIRGANRLMVVARTMLKGGPRPSWYPKK
tara:strand:+ start:1431 stop:2126 length:696 start_codon:yes stop_codon:yes gene_type:complete